MTKMKKTYKKRINDDSELTKKLSAYLLSPECNIEALKILAVIESSYNHQKVFDEKFFKLLDIACEVKDLSLNSLLESENKIAKEYIKSLGILGKDGITVTHTSQAYSSIHNGLIAVVNALSTQFNQLENFYFSKVKFEMAENVAVITINKKYKATFLINKDHFQLLSLFNKETKKVMHYQKVTFRSQTEIHDYFERFEEYAEYTNDVFEMLNI